MTSTVEAQAADAIVGLVEMVTSAKFEDLPASAIDMAKLDILDTIGVSMAALTTAPVSRHVVDLAVEIGGTNESTIIGDGRKVPAHMAAFANATLAHALNYDDYSDALLTHFGCIMFPAALAAAERGGSVSGREFLTSYVVSLDLAARLSRALLTSGDQRNWNLHGWLTTQLVGYFGAAAVAGRLMGLDEGALLNGLGLAYSQVAGNKQVLIGGGADKGIYPSYPAQTGVLSAMMAQKGIRGPKDILEGRNGFYNVFFQGLYERRALTTNLGTSFEEVGFYRYPCCGFAHTRIELAMRMVQEHEIVADDIESITVSVGPMSRLLCEPVDARRRPRSMGEAQYSLPFVIATAITKGAPKIEHFTVRGIDDPETLKLASRVNYVLDDECDLKYGTGHCPAKLEVVLKGGRRLYGEQLGGRDGHPERPISKADLVEKFRDCVGYSPRPLAVEAVDRVIGLVDRLEDSNDVTEIIEAIS